MTITSVDPGAANVRAPIWAATAIIDGRPTGRVRFTADDSGRITAVERGVEPQTGDRRLGTVIPGMGNAHSHAFHRLLRGRTHADGGDFWQWREAMYAAAASLDPDHYGRVARAVFGEMLVCGWTAVGEFHYVHHQADGTPYPTAHAMELAVAEAAADVGIRLTLLDTAYLASGLGSAGGPAAPLLTEQLAFGDGDASGWLARWHRLRAALSGSVGATGLVTLGAALHSVRAVPVDAMRTILAGLPDDVPLHVHLSEQPQENVDTLAKTGRTPTGVLAALGALAPRISLVHATHLTDADITAIGRSGATVVMCPTTEADLGDGIGPARRLADAGARIAVGSDQNAVVDPLLELRGLEAGERLASGRRGRFSPAELLEAGTDNGYRSLGLGRHTLDVGDPLDLVEVSMSSLRTTGMDPAQLALVATASDVERVVVGGRLVAERGRLIATSQESTPEQLLAVALAELAASTETPRAATSSPTPDHLSQETQP
ncbi:formiminoglutamate deiminase [Plantibacter sp. VKM Ac-1784]|uniref:Formiminoglutamate deiminase n=1 Tax=Plantibacter elymi (nom. nud.) TaxID=199708 RepID=A0ABY1RIN1_9MICO|nr:formimidoylglutamate deiminase [Plantibacter sp. VKM Ac-1784]SMQ75250.1 formiminoglutamate deiminase [Plantibacter sp. VKM Ac-1784]